MSAVLGPDERREIDRLRRALKLRRGPEFHMIVGDTRRVVDLALEEVLPGVDLPRIVVGPEEAPKAFAVRWLQRLEDAVRNGGTQPLVLDAWDTDPDHSPHWAWIFGRLNERRNEVLRELARPLLLLVSPDNERVIGAMAPDLWSVRGVGMRLRDRGRVEAEDGVRSWVHVPTTRSTTPEELARLERRVDEVRGRTPFIVQAIESIRLSQGLHEARQDTRALAAADEAVGHYEALTRSDEDKHIDLARALRTRALILAGLERRDAAVDDLRRATSIVTELLQETPGRVDLLHELGSGYRALGDVHLARGDREGARDFYEHAERLGDSADERMAPVSRGTMEGLLDEIAATLAELFFDMGSARLLALRAGFPERMIPGMVTARVFWHHIVRDAYNGVIHGGVETLLREALHLHPYNAELHRYHHRMTAARRHVPSVFVSYSRDSDGHAAEVRALADRLQSSGLDVRLDQYVPSPPEGWPEWTKRQASMVDFIVLVCNTDYRRRFEDENTRTPQSVLAQHLFYAQHDRKQGLLPVLLPGCTEADIPRALRSYTAYTLPDDYDHILRRMTEVSKPW